MGEKRLGQEIARGLTGARSATANAFRNGRPNSRTSISNMSPSCVLNPSEKLSVEVPKKCA